MVFTSRLPACSSLPTCALSRRMTPRRTFALPMDTPGRLQSARKGFPGVTRALSQPILMYVVYTGAFNGLSKPEAPYRRLSKYSALRQGALSVRAYELQSSCSPQTMKACAYLSGPWNPRQPQPTPPGLTGAHRVHPNLPGLLDRLKGAVRQAAR